MYFQVRWEVEVPSGLNPINHSRVRRIWTLIRTPTRQNRTIYNPVQRQVLMRHRQLLQILAQEKYHQPRSKYQRERDIHPLLLQVNMWYFGLFASTLCSNLRRLGKKLVQESIPVGCVPPACWPYPIVSHISLGGGVCPIPSPVGRPRGICPTPPDANHADHVTCDACWEANPPMNRQTGVKHYLPATSFAGGKKIGSHKEDFYLWFGKYLRI